MCDPVESGIQNAPVAEEFAGLGSLPDRIRTMAVLRGLGYSFGEMGRRFDVTPQAASAMLARYRRLLQQPKASEELHGLSARAVNVLGRLGIRSREDARRTDIAFLLRQEKNCGRKTPDEIQRWIRRENRAGEGGNFVMCGNNQNYV